MKVHELITKLEKMPAGADVVITQWNARIEECDYFEIGDISGGELLDGLIQNVYLDKGKKQ